MLSKKDIVAKTAVVVELSTALRGEIDWATGQGATPRPCFKGFRLTGDIPPQLATVRDLIGKGDFQSAQEVLLRVRKSFRAKRLKYLLNWCESSIADISRIRNQEVHRRLSNLRHAIEAKAKVIELDAADFNAGAFEALMIQLSDQHWQVIEGIANPTPPKKALSRQDPDVSRQQNQAYQAEVQTALGESAKTVGDIFAEFLSV